MKAAYPFEDGVVGCSGGLVHGSDVVGCPVRRTICLNMSDAVTDTAPNSSGAYVGKKVVARTRYGPEQ